MSQLQKVFLLLVGGYLATKLVLSLVMYMVTKKIEKKSLEHQKKQANQNKTP